MDILTLKYPMFETTYEEKAMLRKAEIMIATTRHYYLCNALSIILDKHHTSADALVIYKLKCKVRESIRHEAVLNHYLGFSIHEVSHQTNSYIRRVWITKLLNYSGK